MSLGACHCIAREGRMGTRCAANARDERNHLHRQTKTNHRRPKLQHQEPGRDGNKKKVFHNSDDFKRLRYVKYPTTDIPTFPPFLSHSLLQNPRLDHRPLSPPRLPPIIISVLP